MPDGMYDNNEGYTAAMRRGNLLNSANSNGVLNSGNILQGAHRPQLINPEQGLRSPGGSPVGLGIGGRGATDDTSTPAVPPTTGPGNPYLGLLQGGVGVGAATGSPIGGALAGGGLGILFAYINNKYGKQIQQALNGPQQYSLPVASPQAQAPAPQLPEMPATPLPKNTDFSWAFQGLNQDPIKANAKGDWAAANATPQPGDWGV